jgi:hypothetical protein
MQTESTRLIDSPEEEIDSLMEEFDRVDEAVGDFLVVEAKRSDGADSVHPSAQWLRARLREWCHIASATRLFREEVLAATEHALGQLPDHLLVPLAIDLMAARLSERQRNYRRRRRAG